MTPPAQNPETPGPQPPHVRALHAPLLLLTVAAIATCGLIYELIAGTLSSYLLGDSVTQFSTVIGVYLSAMGLGSYLSGQLQRGIAHRFVDIELSVALVGGFSAPALFLAFAYTSHFYVLLYLLVIAIGTLVGLEIPLLLRILRNEYEFKDLVARVLTVDYIGALVASLLFPLFFMPRLGLVRTSLFFGLLNALMGLWSTWLLGPSLPHPRMARVRAGVVIVILLGAFSQADRFTHWMEDELYSGQVVFARTSPYQRIVVTRERSGFQLYLNGNLQFNSTDEYRYHEALVHPAFASRDKVERVLVCGGGDGLALREILRYPQVREVLLVDLDPAMTELGSTYPMLTRLNQSSFADPRVKVINADPMQFLNERPADAAPFDLAIVDFPDPNNFALGKLYTTYFYRLLTRALVPNGVFVVQSTSPLLARTSYWCIANTIAAAGLHTLPFHVAVPSFGEWGYVLASREALSIPARVPPGLRFLDVPTLQNMFVFSPDMQPVPADINRLNTQALVQYYESEWRRWN